MLCLSCEFLQTRRNLKNLKNLKTDLKTHQNLENQLNPEPPVWEQNRISALQLQMQNKILNWPHVIIKDKLKNSVSEDDNTQR